MKFLIDYEKSRFLSSPKIAGTGRTGGWSLPWMARSWNRTPRQIEESMMTRTEFAVTRFKEGFRCSQAVLEAWAPEFGLDPALAREIALPLAGGSALGGECGAVTGAFLVVGLHCGVSRADDAEGFNEVFSKVRELANRFKSLHGSLNCFELLGLDVFSEQGHREFRERDMKLTHCAGYVEDVMGLLEQVISSSSRME
jgi:C_GCAxxG_C_C family probable redox protein